MKKLSGIMKLRLGITTVFLLLILSIIIGFYVVAVDTAAEEVFYERLTNKDIDDLNRIYELTDKDVDDLNRIYEKYPITNTENIIPIAGYLVWAVVLILSYLMYKVWNVKEIR